MYELNSKGCPHRNFLIMVHGGVGPSGWKCWAEKARMAPNGAEDIFHVPNLSSQTSE